jgi:hypothetical protein
MAAELKLMPPIIWGSEEEMEGLCLVGKIRFCIINNSYQPGRGERLQIVVDERSLL